MSGFERARVRAAKALERRRVSRSVSSRKSRRRCNDASADRDSDAVHEVAAGDVGFESCHPSSGVISTYAFTFT